MDYIQEAVDHQEYAWYSESSAKRRPTVTFCQEVVHEKRPTCPIPVTNENHSTKDHIERHEQRRFDQIVHGIQRQIAAYYTIDHCPERANSRCRDCDRLADSAQAVSAASMHVFARDQDRPSSIVILQVTNDCQRAHYCAYQWYDVGDYADQNHQSRVPITRAPFLMSPAGFLSTDSHTHRI